MKKINVVYFEMDGKSDRRLYTHFPLVCPVTHRNLNEQFYSGHNVTNLKKQNKIKSNSLAFSTLFLYVWPMNELGKIMLISVNLNKL